MSIEPTPTAGLEALLIERIGSRLVAGLIRQGRLDDLVVLPVGAARSAGDVVAGRVTRVEAAIDAAFVDIGEPGHALLRGRDLDAAAEPEKRPINRRLHEGQAIAVKIVHLGYDDKGPRVIGRVGAGIAVPANLPAAGTVIGGADPLVRAVQAIRPAVPAEIVVADTLARLQVAQAWPGGDQAAPTITVDPDGRPLARFDAMSDIETALMPEVALAGGGRITFEQTRALLAVDVDSGAGTRDLVALNLAAACEIARQVRIRNSAGIIMLDFIDARIPAERGPIEQALRSATATDRAGCRLAGFGPLGLFEMTRRRLGAPLAALWPGAVA